MGVIQGTERQRQEAPDWTSHGGRGTERQRETEDKRAEDGTERGGSRPLRAAEGRAAESPLCSRAALRGFLRGRGKAVGERADRGADGN